MRESKYIIKKQNRTGLSEYPIYNANTMSECIVCTELHLYILVELFVVLLFFCLGDELSKGGPSIVDPYDWRKQVNEDDHKLKAPHMFDLEEKKMFYQSMYRFLNATQHSKTVLLLGGSGYDGTSMIDRDGYQDGMVCLNTVFNNPGLRGKFVQSTIGANEPRVLADFNLLIEMRALADVFENYFDAIAFDFSTSKFANWGMFAQKHHIKSFLKLLAKGGKFYFDVGGIGNNPWIPALNRTFHFHTLEFSSVSFHEHFTFNRQIRPIHIVFKEKALKEDGVFFCEK